MKFTIERLSTKEIQTSKGPAKKVSFQFGGVWYSAFAGKWNGGWRNGATIEIPDDRVTSNESNGKTFWNIAAPPKDAGGGSGSANLAGVEAKLDQILGQLQRISDHLGLTEDAF